MPQACEKISGTPRYSLEINWITTWEDMVIKLIKIKMPYPLYIETLDLKVQYLFKRKIGTVVDKYPNKPEIK